MQSSISCDIQTILFVFREMFDMNVKTRMCTIIIYTWVPYGQTHILPSILNTRNNCSFINYNQGINELLFELFTRMKIKLKY